MKKFVNEVNIYQDNKIVRTIDSLIDIRMGGDWNDYEAGDKVRYEFSFNDEFELDLDEVKAFVGEGVCLMIDEELWYNVSFEDDVLVVEYLAE